MNDMPRPKAYANDPDFDALTGRITSQSSIVGMTRDGWKVRHTRVYIDIGRASNVRAADPDAMIEEIEELPYVPLYPRKQPKPKPPNVNGLQLKVTAYIKEYGPTGVGVLSAQFGVTPSALARHLTKREGYAYRRTRLSKPQLWGLVEDA